MTILITGVAGFIGSNLAKFFISRNIKVIGLDNFCRGNISNLKSLRNDKLFKFYEINICNLIEYTELISKMHSDEAIDEVWHLAANSDIPAGINDASIDLQDTFMTTFNTLEVMKKVGIKVINFASSSAVYGDLGEVELIEDIGPLFPISNYGAMKLASEALISAALESFLDKCYIFRFPNVIGVPATHGVILDFVSNLINSPSNLQVLGDGTQQKSYLHVDELIDAMQFIRTNSNERCNYYNIGPSDKGITVKSIAEKVRDVVSPNATISYGSGNKGWVGDVPKFSYSIEKLGGLGWSPKMNSSMAVAKAVSEIFQQESSS